jgi:hypothetical protein
MDMLALEKNAPANVTTADNPGNSRLMLWIRDHLEYPHDYCLIWPFGRNTHGYGLLTRKGLANSAHRYICELANGPPPTPQHQAAHSCGRGHDGCVNPRHLSWKTVSENQLERAPHLGRRKLTAEQVEEIRRLKNVVHTAVLAARFNVTDANIRQIHEGKIWRADKRDLQRIYTDEEIRAIRAATGTAREIAEQFKTTHNSVWRIRQRKTYRHVPEAEQTP